MEITTFIDLSKDIYYQQEYSALYEWDGKIFEYLYNENVSQNEGWTKIENN